MRRARFGFHFFIVFIAVFVCGCGGHNGAYDLLSNKVDATGYSSAKSESGLQGNNSSMSWAELPTADDSQQHSSVEPTVSRGTGQLIGSQADVSPGRTLRGDDGVTLNLRSVSIGIAAKTILGDLLKRNYVVDSKVEGEITLQTTTPVSTDGLLEIFEAVLKENGAAIVAAGGVLNVVPTSSAVQSLQSVTRRRARLGYQTLVVPLRYVSASEITRIIEKTGSTSSVLLADRTRNVIVLRATASDLKNVADLIALFDVDWMEGMSVGLFPVSSAPPASLVKELKAVFGSEESGPLDGVVRFLPNRRLNAIMVITSNPSYLDKAEHWIEKLDKVAGRNKHQLFVYKVQNRRAAELSKLLQLVLGGSAATAATSAVGGEVAPRFEPQTISTSDNPVESALQGRSDETPAQVSILGSGAALANALGPSDTLRGVRVVADEGKNALLIMALPRDHDRLRRILQGLDVPQTQVLLEAVIAEVALNDELKFGLRWYFQRKQSSFTFSDAVSGAVNSVFPGFSYFFAATNMQVALNAVSGVTNVQVISAPSLMVQDNRTATLQVGDQVPITTQTAQSVQDPLAPIVNAVELKDTGLILKVTPRVSDSGHVVLDIEQEVSNVVRTTSSGIDSPTIQQRKIETSVAVDDGQVLALGGLIQERNNETKTQVPLLGDIPYVGSVFRNKTDSIERTELLILIRPYVVRDSEEASAVTEEFRSQIKLERPASTRGRRKLDRDFRRMLE